MYAVMATCSYHQTCLYGHHSFRIQLHSSTQAFEVPLTKEKLKGDGRGDLNPPA